MGTWLLAGAGAVAVAVLVTQLCLFATPDPTNCSLSGSCIHGILQARILEWIAVPFSRGSSWSRDWTQVSCIAGRFFIIWATGKIRIVSWPGSELRQWKSNHWNAGQLYPHVSWEESIMPSWEYLGLPSESSTILIFPGLRWFLACKC